MSGRRARAAAVALATLAAGLIGGAASPALVIRAGDLVVRADGGFRPRALPKHADAPITVYGGGNLSTVSGVYPPVLETIELEFDRHGHVETAGLPRCTRADLVATDVAGARRNCGGAIVGTGYGRGVVVFPEQAPIPAASPITLFNSRPKGGDPTILAHAYLANPGPTTFIVPITIERINKGTYGYRVEIRIPKIAGGHGIPLAGRATVGKRWSQGGERLSYINARCATGSLKARGVFSFDDGSRLRGSFAKRCSVRD